MALTAKQKIIIQTFGLPLAEIGVYAAGVGILRAREATRGGPDKQIYLGKTGTPNQPDEPIASSVLGTPVFDNLIIQAGKYTDSVLGAQSYVALRLDSAIITLSQTDNVVLTSIAGRDGEVIEYVSKMSFRINVKAGIFGTGNQRPKSDIETLAVILKSNDVLKVQSGFLSEWNISELVILNKNIPQIPGGYNYQIFEFNAIENVPVILAQQSANIG
jgi:hypothetical protein